MPHIQDLWSEVEKRHGDRAEFLCINIGDAPAVIESYWKENRWGGEPVMQQGQRVSETFGVVAYPTTYVLGPDGRVLYRGVGFNEHALRKILLPRG